MSENQEDFKILMQRVHEGSEEAWKQLVKDYGPHILRIVRLRFDRRLRSKFDSEDFQQDVWASFLAARSHTIFERPEALAAYLAEVARNKIRAAERERFQLKKHNVDREHSLDGSAAFEARGVAGQDPTPSQLLVAQEAWDRFLKGHPARYQRVFNLLRLGHNQAEIAAQLGMCIRTVQRVSQLLTPEAIS